MGLRALPWRHGRHGRLDRDETRAPDAPSREATAGSAVAELDARGAAHAAFAGLLAAIFAGLALLGWALDEPLLVSLLPGAATFKATTAVAVFAAAISLVLQAQTLRADSRLAARVARVLACVPLLIGVGTLAEYAFKVDLGIDQLPRANTRISGRPSPFSGVALTLIATALLLGPRTRRVVLHQASTVVVGLLGWAALVVLAYDFTVLALVPGFPTVSFPAAICFLSLAYGALWLRPRATFMEMLRSDTVAGATARMLVPLATLVPVAFGWLYLLGIREGWFDTRVGLSLFTMGIIAGYLLVGGLGALRMYRLESVRDRATEARRQLAERLQLATRSAHIGIWDWDLATNGIVWDRGMHELYGIPEGQFPGTYEAWRELLVPDDIAQIEKSVRGALSGGHDLQIEFRIRRADGAVRTMQGRSVVVRDDAGEPVRILGADIDITALREAEALRLASERRFRGIFDSATQFVALLRIDGTVVEVNRTALDFIGASPNDVVGTPLWQSGGCRGLPETQEAVRQGVARAARGELVRFRATCRARGDELATVDFSIKPLYGPGGEVAQLLAEGRDITEAEKARVALVESEERFRAAMEYAAIGMALVSLEGRFLKVNRALCEIVGYSEEELLERNFRDITHPQDLEADVTQAQELLAGRISHYHMEKRYFHKSGRVVWILLSGSLVRSATGQPRVFVAEIQDITARKADEARLRASVIEKEVLLKEIHHRVKNNLQVISSILRLQAAQADTAEVRDKFEDAQTRIHAMALIHDRLYQSRNLASIDFAPYLRELAAMLFRIFANPEQRIGLESSLEPVLLNLDTAIPLGLVANELITNSLKHAFVGHAEGTVWVSLASEGGRLTLTVADDGVGFPPDFGFESRKSLGVRLVSSLAHQLRGTLGVHRGERKAISLTIPFEAST